MLRASRFLLLFLIIIQSNACTKKNTGVVLAKAFDNTLYDYDLVGIVANGTSVKDSILIAENYIENWVQQQIIVHQAEKVLSNNEKNFSKQLEDFRNSLLVYNFDNNLIIQSLDTIVSDNEINKYYEEHTQEFELKSNIVKVLYVKIAKKSPFVSQFKQFINKYSDNPKERLKLADLAQKQANNFFLDDQNWLQFDELLKEVPIKTFNQEQFLSNNKTIEIVDEEFIYLLNIKEFKTKESTSPLNFEKDNIKNIIIQKRKLKVVKDAHDALILKAKTDKDVEIF